MTEDDAEARPHREMGVLTFEEKRFLLAVERGDVANVTR
jgi:transient receptor potential cation channel subfamily C protein 4